MATYTYEIATEYNFPNITIYRKLKDGELCGWRANTNEGYVMYNPNAVEYEEGEDGNVIEIYYYYVLKVLPLNFNFANFPWVAVPRDSVDENYIFGGADSSHEVM